MNPENDSSLQDRHIVSAVFRLEDAPNFLIHEVIGETVNFAGTINGSLVQGVVDWDSCCGRIISIAPHV